MDRIKYMFVYMMRAQYMFKQNREITYYEL